MEIINENVLSEYVLKGDYVISYVTAKLQTISRMLSEKEKRQVIVYIGDRIKSNESILEKCKRKKIEPSADIIIERVHDIFGIRAVCIYQDELYQILKILLESTDIHIRKIKDYIKSPKKSGYRSIHIQMEIPLPCAGKVQWICVELQLRTVAMNYWAELDHELRYKKETKQVAALGRQLKQYAGLVADMDNKILELRQQIVAL